MEPRKIAKLGVNAPADRGIKAVASKAMDDRKRCGNFKVDWKAFAESSLVLHLVIEGFCSFFP